MRKAVVVFLALVCWSAGASVVANSYFSGRGMWTAITPTSSAFGGESLYKFSLLMNRDRSRFRFSLDGKGEERGGETISARISGDKVINRRGKEVGRASCNSAAKWDRCRLEFTSQGRYVELWLIYDRYGDMQYQQQVSITLRMEAKYDEGFNFLHYDVDAVTAIARMPFDRSVNCSFLPRPPACNF